MTWWSGHMGHLTILNLSPHVLVERYFQPVTQPLPFAIISDPLHVDCSSAKKVPCRPSVWRSWPCSIHRASFLVKISLLSKSTLQADERSNPSSPFKRKAISGKSSVVQWEELEQTIFSSIFHLFNHFLFSYCCEWEDKAIEAKMHRFKVSFWNKMQKWMQTSGEVTEILTPIIVQWEITWQSLIEF